MRKTILMRACVTGALVAALVCLVGAQAQDVDVAKKLECFDEYMAKVLKDWNGPGIGVGIVVGDKLVFAKGYGYRDYEKKLPFTPGTVCPVASNTKLFTAVAAGMLGVGGEVAGGKTGTAVGAAKPAFKRKPHNTRNAPGP